MTLVHNYYTSTYLPTYSGTYLPTYLPTYREWIRVGAKIFLLFLQRAELLFSFHFCLNVNYTCVILAVKKYVDDIFVV